MDQFDAITQPSRRVLLWQILGFFFSPNIEMNVSKVKDIVEWGWSIGQRLLRAITWEFDPNEYIAPKELPRVLKENSNALWRINQELEKEWLPKLLWKDQGSVDFWTQELYYLIRKQTEERDGKLLDQLPRNFLKYFDPLDSILDIEDGYIEDMILDLERGSSITWSLREVVWRSYDFYIPWVTPWNWTRVEVSFDNDWIISLEWTVFQSGWFVDFIIDWDIEKISNLLSKWQFELRNIFIENGTRVYKNWVSIMKFRKEETTTSKEETKDWRKFVLSNLLSTVSEPAVLSNIEIVMDRFSNLVQQIFTDKFPKQQTWYIWIDWKRANFNS